MNLMHAGNPVLKAIAASTRSLSKNKEGPRSERRRCPRAAGTRRAHGDYAAISALLVVNDVH